MSKTNLPRPLTEKQAAEEATVEFLRNKFPKMNQETAKLWIRAMANERTEPEQKLGDHIENARKEAKATLKQEKIDDILSKLKQSLGKEDYFEVFAFIDDAEKMGIKRGELNDLIDSIPTKLDRKALKSRELPLSAIA